MVALKTSNLQPVKTSSWADTRSLELFSKLHSQGILNIGTYLVTPWNTPLAQLSLFDLTQRLHFHALEKEMATHSSVLAWRIPGTGEPGGLPSMGSHRVGHNWSDLAVAATFENAYCFFLLKMASSFGMRHDFTFLNVLLPHRHAFLVLFFFLVNCLALVTPPPHVRVPQESASSQLMVIYLILLSS